MVHDAVASKYETLPISIQAISDRIGNNSSFAILTQYIIQICSIDNLWAYCQNGSLDG